LILGAGAFLKLKREQTYFDRHVPVAGSKQMIARPAVTTFERNSFLSKMIASLEPVFIIEH
jgi:hypothetical protein